LRRPGVLVEHPKLGVVEPASSRRVGAIEGTLGANAWASPNSCPFFLLFFFFFIIIGIESSSSG
jgi:hypothetical protein